MEIRMTSIDTARFPSFETTSHTYERRTYDAGIPSRHDAWFNGLDKVAYSLAALMALGPLAMAAYGALIVGA